MPGRFKSLSEYTRNFKWKTADFPLYGRLTPEQKQTWAGLRSDQLGITKEPSFPSKRRVPYYNPQISKSFEWKGDLTSDHIEPRTVHHKDTSDRENVETPKAPRVPAKKLRSRSADSIVQYAKESRVQAENKLRRAHHIREKKNAANAQLKSGQHVCENKAETGHVPQTRQSATQTKEPAPSKTRPEKHSEGLHRVLQKKAGLSVAPQYNPMRTSEYSRQFVWKDPTVNSPMLAAEQVINNKNHSVQPFKTDVIPRETEYHSQFKGSPQAKGPILRSDWEDKNSHQYEPEDIASEKKNKREERRPEEKRLPGPVQKEANQKKLLLPSHGHRKMKTEYESNFVSPTEYRYRDGAWVRVKQHAPEDGPHNALGAVCYEEVQELREQAEAHKRRVLGTHFSRDHLNQILSHNNSLWEATSTSSTDTLSTNIKALDLAGDHRPLSVFQKGCKPAVPSLAQTRVSAEKELLQNGGSGSADHADMPVRRRLVWDEEGGSEQIEPIREEEQEEEEEEEDCSEEEETQPVQKLEQTNGDVRRAERKNGEVAITPDNVSEHSSVSDREGGRLPTPTLKTLWGVQRTHHDLTTPAIGGAVLVSPSKIKSPLPERRTKTSPERRYSPHKRVPRECGRTKLSKTENGLLLSPPTAGMRTQDPIPLRKEHWPLPDHSITSPVKTRPECWAPLPVQKPPVVPASPYWSQCCRIHGALRDPEFQHNGNIANCGQFRLPLYSTSPNDEDDDRMSQISARSAASSSRASETLERAQKRKENFWGKK